MDRQGNFYALWHGRLHRVDIPRLVKQEATEEMIRNEMQESYKWQVPKKAKLVNVKIVAK